jgi:RHS repeat-associated protein
MDYYPFGAQFWHSGTDNNVQPYRYNGKEFDKMHGLNTYDYGARQYNPVTARWDRVDPLAEKYYSISPYVYCVNNPIKYIDPNGAYVVDSLLEDNSFYGTVVVMSSNFMNKKSDYNGALFQDYKAARRAGVPIILVDDVFDFSDALSELKKRNITVDTYSICSHGTSGSPISPAHFYIGFEVITSTTDVSSLREGLQNRNVFINACNVGAETDNALIRHFAKQTSSTVIASQHSIYGGYRYDGSDRLDFNSLYNNYNLYSISLNGGSAYTITDVSITKERGISWGYNSNVPFQYNIKRNVPWK